MNNLENFDKLELRKFSTISELRKFLMSLDLENFDGLDLENCSVTGLDLEIFQSSLNLELF